MKTPMQELIETLTEKSATAYLPHRAGLEYAIEQAKSLLEKEKQAIVDAFDYGYSSGYDDAQGDGATFESGEQYYNETYK